MNIVEIYKLCKESGINIQVEAGNLRVTTQSGVIPDSIKSLLKEHKQAMIELLSAGSGQESQRIKPHPELVLSYTQQRMWFQQQYDQQSAIYNIPLILKSDSLLDASSLQASLQHLLQRHQVLRTVINNQSGIATPKLLHSENFALVVQQVTDSSNSDAIFAELAHQQTSVAFDLSKDFMLRGTLVQVAEQYSVLFLTLHHIAADAWSLDILLHELNQVYSSITAQQEPALKEVALQYSDYAAWQQTLLNDSGMTNQLSYWKDRLANIPDTHRFPTDKKRPANPSFKGERLRFHLDTVTSQQLQSLAMEKGATTFSLVQAAFATLIAKYSGLSTDSEVMTDVVIGTPVANRHLPEVDKMVGFFANTIPLRTQIDLETRFSDLLGQVQHNTLNDLSNQNVPLEMLIDELNLTRKTSHNPLFQMMLVFESASENNNTAQSDSNSSLFSRYSVDRAETGSKFDLTLIARQSEKGLAFAWEFAHDLFERETIQRLADNFLRLLQSVAECPESKLSDLDCVSDSEKQFLIETGVGDAVAQDESATIHGRFEQQAAKQPNAVALVYGDESLTYAQLNEKANSVAQALMEKGIVPGDMIGICMGQSLDFPVAVLGVLKSGAAYLPMDKEYPAARIKHIVSDSKAKLWLSNTAETAGKVLGEHGVETLLISEILQVNSAISPSAISRPTMSSQDLAYMIYTSGSTGLPKGTMLEHVGAVNLSQVQQQQFAINDAASVEKAALQSKVLQFASISFDAATWEILMSLCNGAQLIIPNAEQKQDPAKMAALVQRHAITHATLPPAYLSLFETEQLASLTHLIVAGEAISRSEAEKWCVGRHFFNAYGPTETTVCATIGEYQGGVVHMGRSIANHKALVLDAAGKLAPIGAIGELYLGGIGLARGYHNNEALTQERFVALSVGVDKPQRFYRSGDLVRWLPSGVLEYIGRTDNQVQVRGFRVELGEIEAAIAQHPEVQAGFVQVSEKENGSQLTAYFTVSEGALNQSGDSLRKGIKQLLEQTLPYYMIPSAYVPLSHFPLTTHGKIDVEALPQAGEADTVKSTYVAPTTDAQRLVCSVLQDLLHLEQVGIKDSFFGLGGDSILSIQAVARINAFGYHLTSKQFFEAQSVENIAQILAESSATGVEYSQAESVGEMQLLPIQQRFFLLQNQDNDRYLQSALLHVPEAVNEAFLRAFVDALYQRHDMLRVRFTDLESVQPKAHFAPLIDVDLSKILDIVDISRETSELRQSAILAASEQAKSSINIAQGCLFKMVYMKAEKAQDSRLLLIFHHLIVDGVSWRIVLDDLALAYQQHIAGGDVHLGNKATTYQQWSKQYHSWLQSEDAVADVAYWQDKAALNRNPAMVQALLSKGKSQSDLGSNTLADSHIVKAQLDTQLTQSLLKDCHQAYRTQINDLLLSALVNALAKWRPELSGKSVSVFLEGHGREDDKFEHTDLSQCMGWFTSLYPVIFSAEKNPDELILGVKELTRQIPSRGLGYLGTSLQSSAQQMGVLFNYLGQFDQQLGKTQLFARANEDTGFDVARSRLRESLLGFNGQISNGQLQFNIDFSRELFAVADIEQLARTFETALTALIEHCRTQKESRVSPSDFPLCHVSQIELEMWQDEYGEIDDLYPASGNQMGMYYHAQLDAQSSYATQNLLHFNRDFNPQTFKQAWQILVQRHAVLRTVFVALDKEQSLQLVQRHVELNWIEKDIASLSQFEQDDAIQDYLESDNAIPIDYQKAPLSRFALFNRGEQGFSFIWTCSHTILDGWSLGVVYDELLTLYRALLSGVAPESVGLPNVASYKQYIAWTLEQSNQASTEFWQQELENAELSNAIGIEASNNEVAHQGKQVLKHTLPSGQYQALRSFAAQQNMTMSTLVQAAWGYLLCSYRDTDHIITGVTLSGRPADLPGVESTVGMMINTVPACIRVSPEWAIRDWLQSLQNTQSQRERFGFVPLAEIVQHKNLDEGEQLFNTVLGFHNQPIEDAAELMRESDMRGGVAHEETHYPLVLGVAPHQDLVFTLTYDSNLFSSAAMDRLVSHLTQVLSGLIAPENKTLADIHLLSDAEITALVQLSESQKLPAQTTLVPAQLSALAVSQADAQAVVMEAESLSFAELDAQSNLLARALVKFGVKAGDRVGMCLDRSVEMVVAVLGIMKSGGVYVPLDPTYPDERLSYLIQDAGISHVVTEVYLADQLPLNDQQVLLVSECIDDSDERDEEAETAVEVALAASTPAYMIYTSGSTGQPKGVLVNHGALAQRLAGLQHHYQLNGEDKGLLFASMSFDASLSQLLLPLCAGAAVVIRPDDVTEPEALMEYIQATGVSFLHVVPAYLKQLVAVSGWQDSRLRIVVSGGDVFDTGLLDSWFNGDNASEREGIALYNSYGPTEIVITSSSHRVSVKALESKGSAPIGKPLANTSYWIVDAQGQLLPQGVVGELCIGGDSLAEGYWQREAQTAERFVELRFNNTLQRVYRTGDRVKWNDAGELVFVGRQDNQVKVRGYRIELGEIEAALKACQGVTEAVVKAEDDGLWAFLSLDENRTTLTQVEEELATHLPGYLLPSGFETITEWPLTASGKIDRNKLVRGLEQDSGSRAPKNDTEIALQKIWAELLKVEEVGVTDNFFQMGGHSLLATRLASQIRRQFEVNFTLKSLFELPSIEEQAAMIVAEKGLDSEFTTASESDNASSFVPTIPVLEGNEPSPLSHAQNSLWLMEQMDSSGASYIAGTAMTISGNISREAIEQAFATIVERHQVLRTVIREYDGQPMQQVVDNPEFNVGFTDLSALDAGSQDQEILNMRREAKLSRFDLAQDVMLRVHLVKQSDTQHTLLLHMHHIVCDGWSIGLLMQEFNILYQAYSEQAEAKLPDLPVQYRDYASWQKAQLSGEKLDELAEYWTQRLADIPSVHQLPMDFDRPDIPSYRGEVYRQQLSGDVKTAFSQLSRNNQTTFFMAMHAAFSAWLARYSGSDDIVLGSAIANREQSEVANLIGFFSNVLVLRSQIDNNESFASLLSKVKTNDIADFDHQQMPFELLVEKLNPERTPQYNPLFQIVLNVDNNDGEDLQVSGSEVKGGGQLSYESNFDLTLYAVEQESGIKLVWRYASDLFTETTIARMSNSFSALLQAAIANPDTLLKDLPLVSDAESQALSVLAMGEVLPAQTTLVPAQLSALAVSQADAQAVVMEAESLSFAELDAQSNLLARALVKFGVKAGDRVGMCLDRSVEMVVAVLGIMKSGGVYVPLDPTYPDERLSYLIQDAGISHVVTEVYLADQLPLNDQQVLLVSECIDDSDERDEEAETAVEVALAASTPAYMIYTSGSTGQPKGVLVNHGALAQRLAGLQHHYQLNGEDKGLIVCVHEFRCLIEPAAIAFMCRCGGGHPTG
ncbi:amino acid adenylation domain-containing protein [Paraneptunicella aestuarii]|uniref:non-ribosomal peptide synthetase n=1 Tax=Paraneptunicella aestuarii TaxID=2831148 RepID=UPI001E4CC4F0|nr:non-ribosomal peptide synthetase [Paraneptunicella aestuarii]UAA37423.1 amino acid adenylation domain-containing protein [Paraneptunicella aestuarii]